MLDISFDLLGIGLKVLMLVLKSCSNIIDQLVYTHLVSVPVQNWQFKTLESPSHSFRISFGDLGAVLLHSSLEVDAFK
jgi:hypothetical protein